MWYRLAGSLVLLTVLAADARAAGERVALCVGVNTYDHGGLDNLKYAEADATAFAAILRDAGYRVVLMTNTTGKVLDPKLTPTRANIRAQVEALLEPRKRDDLVILAFSGHGLEFDKDPDTYFCPADARPQATRKDTLLSLDWVYTQLGECGAGTKLLLADCCRTDPNPARGRGPDDTLEKTPPKGVLALYACAPGQRAYEHPDLKHGVFFHHVLEGMQGKVGKPDEDVGLEDLVAYVRKEVPKTVKTLTGRQQTPTLKAPNLSGEPVVLLTPADRQVVKDSRELNSLKASNRPVAEYYQRVSTDQVAVWRIAAERGSARGMLLYGQCLEGGFAVARRPAEAERWLRQAAELGDPLAMTAVGCFYLFGTALTDSKIPAAIRAGLNPSITRASPPSQTPVADEKEAEHAVRWFRRAAELGDPIAMVNLGTCYREGFGVAKDEAEAVKWYRKAADIGDARAMNNLGACYHEGVGVAESGTEAVKWYRKSAQLGEPLAMVNLGWCYESGVGLEKDASEAVKWFRMAADIGNPHGMLAMSLWYGGGRGRPKDAIQQQAWLDKFVEAGGEFKFGLIHYTQYSGIAVTDRRLLNWYRAAADRGEAWALFNLGWCAERGAGGRVDEPAAARWYRKAAEAGHLLAMNNLGDCYRDGAGVASDPAEAFKWYRKAADLGESIAMFNLGDCYEDGTGVVKDIDEAVKWYRKAAAAGVEAAKAALKRLGKE